MGRTLSLAALGTAVSRSLDAGTAILVADYGMAARVGIPTAIIGADRRAYRHDILIKGPRVLENLARVDTVVFDKTGTLTVGAPRVTRVVRTVRSRKTRSSGWSPPRSGRSAIRSRGPWPASPPSAARGPGAGDDVGASRPRRRRPRRRRSRARSAAGASWSDTRSRSAAALGDERAAHAVGASPLFVAVDGRLAALLVLQDQLRDDAPDAVQALRARQMRNVILLSGDHPEPTRVIAESLGLRHHYAELLPEDKARLIRELKAEGRVVAMVGDGVNDALALGEADVGIAVPGGAEVATEAADVVLLRGGLDRVVRALDLARESIDAVRRTLGIAARANLIVVGLASFGFARPVASILLTHGTTVAAALLNTSAAGRRHRP